jgi:hypothetical protein
MRRLRKSPAIVSLAPRWRRGWPECSKTRPSITLRIGSSGFWEGLGRLFIQAASHLVTAGVRRSELIRDRLPRDTFFAANLRRLLPSMTPAANFQPTVPDIPQQIMASFAPRSAVCRETPQAS